MPFKTRYSKDSTGKVSYGHKVIVSIISLATMEIRGVSCLSGSKIKTEVRRDIINVDVFIDVTFGSSCADVAFRVQENVKRSIETMTNFKVGTINVNVLGVCFDENN